MIKSVIHSILHRAGLEVTRRHPERLEESRVLAVANELGLKTIVDVGANVGQFSLGLFQAGFKGRIVSFEPLTAEHATLTRCSKAHASWTVAPRCAIGDSNGQITIHRAGNSQSSSLLPMLREHEIAAPDSKMTSDEVTDIRRLDQCPEVTEGTSGPLFLKVDTQGFELQVLRGATGLMPRIQAMLLEASLSPLYEGGPLFTDVLDHVRGLGFTLVDLVPGFQSPAGKMLQVNLIVVRKAG
mgnify:CR=1 FL=1